MAAVSDCCDNLRRRPKLLKVLDIVLILFVLHPCMVLYWRGIWDLWGVYVNPKPFPANQWKILCVSCSTIFGYFIGPKLNEYTINKSRAQQVRNMSYVIMWCTYPSFICRILRTCFQIMRCRFNWKVIIEDFSYTCRANTGTRCPTTSWRISTHGAALKSLDTSLWCTTSNSRTLG